MYHIGEALVGEGPELAHVDLVLGEKDGPVGAAFATHSPSSLPGTRLSSQSSGPT